MIINRYLVRELSRPVIAILGVLVALFASYSAANFLSDAVNGLLPIGAVMELTGLKVLISLEVLIPAALYASVILVFAKLNGESELAAMSALRITPAAIMRAVIVLSACLALVVGCLSLFVRPWAYGRLHELSGRAATLLDVDAMEAGSFYVGRNGTRVISIAHRDGPGTPARNVFVKLRHKDRTEIISARLAYSVPHPGSGDGPEVYLRDAYVYEIDRDKGRPDQVIHAQGFVTSPNSNEVEPPGYSAVAASSRRLAASAAPEDVAEFQWRISTPLSTLLLALMGIPLSRTRPRQGRSSVFVTAMLVYFGYYLLSTSARTWVQHGEIARFPGIWWPPALLALVLLATLHGSVPVSASRRRRA